MRTMDIWYAHLGEDELMQAVRGAGGEAAKETRGAKKEPEAARKKAKQKRKAARKGARRRPARRRARETACRHCPSWVSWRTGGTGSSASRRSSSRRVTWPPRPASPPDEIDRLVRDQFRAYRATLRDDQRHLLERFQIVDMARKVVGVGSVGTRAFIVLLQGRDPHDPLFLQVKEATASVLEAFLPKSRYQLHGKRVVQGQRMMQAASDIYLGWTKAPDGSRHFYWRQLRDMKGSADVESMTPVALTFYARICGWTLARAHARSGDPVAIAACLGGSDAFDRSVTDFSLRYADQNERDYEEFVKAIQSGRLEAREGV